MYSLKFNPAKAEALFDGLLRLDSTDLSILQDAADFYRENHRYEKALCVLPLVIAHPQVENWQKANAHADIGEMYTATGQLEPAMQAYLVCQKAYADMLQANPNRFFYKNGLAVSYSQLGWFFQSKKNDKEKARNYYLQCQALGQEIAKDYPSFVDFKDRLKWVQNALKALDK